MNKPKYLGLSISDITKTLMYKFWYHYIKPRYQENANLCYMDTYSFIIHIKTEDFYEDIADNREKRFDTTIYEVDRPSLEGQNKKVIGLMKDKLGGKIMTKLFELKIKTYSYLTDDDINSKRAKGVKTCVIKRILQSNDY